MNEKPILFSIDMVSGVLAGTKTQTRRVIKPEWYRCLDFEELEDINKALLQCPYGKPGDHLWVRETFTSFSQRHLRHNHDFYYPVHKHLAHYPDVIVIYKADGSDFPKHFYDDKMAHWKPSIFMRRFESRIDLEIIQVRVERLQDISDADICAETGSPLMWPGPGPEPYRRDLRAAFSGLWDTKVKRAYSWASNPWVWVIEFKKI